MSAKGVGRTGLAGAAVAMVVTGVALAAPPLPEAGKVGYTLSLDAKARPSAASNGWS